MQIYKTFFGERLREALRRAGKTQAYLAEKMGVKDSTVSRWVNGHDFPDDDKIPGICEALKIERAFFENAPLSDLAREPERAPRADPAVADALIEITRLSRENAELKMKIIGLEKQVEENSATAKYYQNLEELKKIELEKPSHLKARGRGSGSSSGKSRR